MNEYTVADLANGGSWQSMVVDNTTNSYVNALITRSALIDIGSDSKPSELVVVNVGSQLYATRRTTKYSHGRITGR